MNSNVVSLRPEAEAVAPDNAAAVEFLRAFHPAARWALTAIAPDGGGTETRTFGAGRADMALGWIAKHNGRRNLYVHVGGVDADIGKKAEKSEIARTQYLHVDVDPRAGEDLAAEQVRIGALLSDGLPAGVPPPTLVVFSGGGHQAYWRLREPVALGGDAAAIEDSVKSRNRWLAKKFDADHCHDVSRIMRLPGTVNVPDAKKCKRGRVAALAKLISHDAERVYDLTEFPAVCPPGRTLGTARRDAAASTGPSVPSRAAVRLADVAELDKYGVPDRRKIDPRPGSASG